MIYFERAVLDNGLRVLIHQDKTTPLAILNVMYDVGSRDEDPERTGFAHLFEHLMFGGSENVAKYDEPLERVGGENNAFTNSDVTNYYCSLPHQNLETAFWIESDRMNQLAFNPKSLQVQRRVVSEEFRQVYLNQPYGDAWLLLRPLAYKTHPYRWPTIGKQIKHVQEASMENVKTFYRKYYNPNNAVLVVAGNISSGEVMQLAENWFGSIQNQNEAIVRKLPKEPMQTRQREQTVERDVPANAVYLAFHMCDRLSPDYYATDLISDILSNGNSSRLYQKLVKEQQLFSNIDAYITGEMDEGLFIVTGKVAEGTDPKKAKAAVFIELKEISKTLVEPTELQKVKNKVEAALEYAEMSVLSRAVNLAFFEVLGDAGQINKQVEQYRKVTIEQIQKVASELFRPANCSILNYKAKIQNS